MIDEATATKLAATGVACLSDAFRDQDGATFAGMPFEERIRIAVDQAYEADVAAKVRRLETRAHLRYRSAGLRLVRDADARGIGTATLAEISPCAFVTAGTNLALQGPTGTGKTWLACAIAREACARRLRSYYIRMPDLEERIEVAAERPQGVPKLVRSLSKYSLLVLDEWLLDRPDQRMVGFPPELTELRQEGVSTVMCTQYRKEDRHSRLGGVHAEAIVDWLATTASGSRCGVSVCMRPQQGEAARGRRRHDTAREPNNARYRAQIAAGTYALKYSACYE